MSDMMAIYAGQTNKRIVELFQQRGGQCRRNQRDGRWNGTRPAEGHDPVVEDGKKKVLRGDHAGSIEEIDTTLIELLLRQWLPAGPGLRPPSAPKGSRSTST
ncbi:MAG: hypothetical protein R2849_10750 [Thermomicrobiales bacterium]